MLFQAAPLPPGHMQTPQMFAMPPPLPNQPVSPIQHGMGHPSFTGPPGPGPSKIDPNQIPHPIPTSSVILFETRQNNQANPPPVCLVPLFFYIFMVLSSKCILLLICM